MFGLRRPIFVQRSADEHTSECIVSTVKHGGGSVMICDCFGGTIMGDVVKIKGILKKEQYRNVSGNNVIPSDL